MAGAAITLDELLEDVGVCPEKLDKHISEDHILEIAFILTEWKAVVPFLGLNENDVEAIEQEEKKEQVRKLKALRKWRGKVGCRATYKKLVVVLLKLAKADIADEVCRLLKDSHRPRADTRAQLQERDTEIARQKRELETLRLEQAAAAREKADREVQLQKKEAEIERQKKDLEALMLGQAAVREREVQLQEKEAKIEQERRGLEEKIEKQRQELQTLMLEQAAAGREKEAREVQLQEKQAKIERQRREFEVLMDFPTALMGSHIVKEFLSDEAQDFPDGWTVTWAGQPVLHQLLSGGQAVEQDESSSDDEITSVEEHDKSSSDDEITSVEKLAEESSSDDEMTMCASGVVAEARVKVHTKGRVQHGGNVDIDGDYFFFNAGSAVGLIKILEPMNPLLNYYEYLIVSRGQEAFIAIGVGERAYPMDRQPGWNQNSCGYHADDGNLYYGRGKGIAFGPTCTDGDRMGCGVDFNADYSSGYVNVFFTKNGKQVGDVVIMKKPKHGLYPLIGLHSKGEKVKYLGHWHHVQDGNVESMEQHLSLMTKEWMKLHTYGRVQHGASTDIDGDYFYFKEGSTGVIKILEPMNPLLNYYEYLIVSRGQEVFVGIGVGERAYPLNRMPGWNQNSCGYHADDGNLYHERGHGTTFGPSCTDGDRMGCGVDFSTERSCGNVSVFFTKNGKQVGNVVRMKKPEHGLYPLIGLHSRGDRVKYLGHWHRVPDRNKELIKPGPSRFHHYKTCDDFCSLDDYAHYVKNNIAVGLMVRCCESYRKVHLGDIGRVTKIDNEGLHDLNVQVNWQQMGNTYWVRYANCELLEETETAGATTFNLGDKVQVKQSVSKPKYNWGSVSHQSIGVVKSINSKGTCVVVDFPEQNNWIGLISEMEIVPGLHPSHWCDGCRMGPIIGPRYHCQVCANFDFCRNCFDKERFHNHPFERINDQGKPAVYVGSPRKARLGW